MAETEREEQSLSKKDEASSSEKDMANDPADTASASTSDEPVGEDKSEASSGEVMSLKECCREAFGKITEYLSGELASKLGIALKLLLLNTTCLCIRYIIRLMFLHHRIETFLLNINPFQISNRFLSFKLKIFILCILL